MIYVSSKFKVYNSNSSSYKYDCTTYDPNYAKEELLNTSNLYCGNNYTFATFDNTVFLLGVDANNYIRLLPYGISPFISKIQGYSYSSYTLRILDKISVYGGIGVLKEGWYINYMGCIYDYQGNIVE